MPPNDPTLVTLLPQGAEGDLGAVCRSLNLSLVRVESPGALLEAARSPAVLCLLVSLRLVGEDPALLEALGAAMREGRHLLFSSSDPIADAGRLPDGLRPAPLVREPLEREELGRELGPVRSPPPGVPIPQGPGPEEGAAFVGRSPAMREIETFVSQVGATDAPALLQGEPGTGRERVARTLHRLGPRAQGAFVAVNCAGIPERYLELELFGQEEGMVPGGPPAKIGRLERSTGGTLFLDEVEELSPLLQVRLLRALVDGELERLGGTKTRPWNARVIAASDGSLESAVESGRFREDLFFQLSSVRLSIPPLRDRVEDVLPLTLHFARRFSERYHRPVVGISDDAIRHLESHSWPGNASELRNALDRAVLRCRGGWILVEDLSLHAPHPHRALLGDVEAGYAPTRSLEDVEADHIRKVLGYTGGGISAAADILGIHRNTLTRKIEAYGLRGPEDGGE